MRHDTDLPQGRVGKLGRISGARPSTDVMEDLANSSALPRRGARRPHTLECNHGRQTSRWSPGRGPDARARRDGAPRALPGARPRRRRGEGARAGRCSRLIRLRASKTDREDWREFHWDRETARPHRRSRCGYRDRSTGSSSLRICCIRSRAGLQASQFRGGRPDGEPTAGCSLRARAPGRCGGAVPRAASARAPTG